ncbi:YeeE/YedE family protein [Psychromonas sp. L1A2]|uniref:YeeE/YedE family protein n=1 Tax=Psychromonas sp. L1A2 TaxID=2686356 RepID=UPI00135A6192|nr:YeeE/YedE family protein [Psychromonas sp. L1A2]
MENFTPWTSLMGGALLGLSATLLMLFSGKVAGISGILNGLLTPKKGDFLWRLFFIIGMASSILLLSPFSIELPELSGQPLVFIIAGLLVGFGTRLGNGCTSGHGIVGIGRFSTRSIIATCVFIGVAAFVVFLRLHVGV